MSELIDYLKARKLSGYEQDAGKDLAFNTAAAVVSWLLNEGCEDLLEITPDILLDLIYL